MAEDKEISKFIITMERTEKGIHMQVETRGKRHLLMEGFPDAILSMGKSLFQDLEAPP